MTARFVIMATGCLSSPNTPKIPGLEDFKGPTYHTGNWPHEGVDFTGKTVGVIGTGSSAIQSIPIIARQASHLTVFQRTANYTVPAHNRPLDPAYVSDVKANYDAMRHRAKKMPAGIDFAFNPASAIETDEAERRRLFEERWNYGGLGFMGSFSDLLLNAEFEPGRGGFRARQDPRDREGSRARRKTDPDQRHRLQAALRRHRLLGDLQPPHVTLVDVSDEPIERITADRLRAKGKDYSFDCLVLATGFDAMTGALLRVDIRGRGGQSLQDKWKEGPKSYLGLTVAGFPNLFTITGPGSPSVLTNMLPSIEQHVEWIAECIEYMRSRGATLIEPSRAAEEAWVGHVGEAAGGTLRSTCSSWYVGANIPGKPRVFMPYIGGFPAYIERCEAVVKNGYEGFSLSLSQQSLTSS